MKLVVKMHVSYCLDSISALVYLHLLPSSHQTPSCFLSLPIKSNLVYSTTMPVPESSPQGDNHNKYPFASVHTFHTCFLNTYPSVSCLFSFSSLQVISLTFIHIHLSSFLSQSEPQTDILFLMWFNLYAFSHSPFANLQTDFLLFLFLLPL